MPSLDDLFRKTKAAPQIYYLPLSDEQVASKLAAEKQQLSVAAQRAAAAAVAAMAPLPRGK